MTGMMSAESRPNPATRGHEYVTGRASLQVGGSREGGTAEESFRRAAGVVSGAAEDIWSSFRGLGQRHPLTFLALLCIAGGLGMFAASRLRQASEKQ